MAYDLTEVPLGQLEPGCQFSVCIRGHHFGWPKKQLPSRPSPTPPKAEGLTARSAVMVDSACPSGSYCLAALYLLRKVDHAQRTAKIRARHSHADWTWPHWRGRCRDKAHVTRGSWPRCAVHACCH